MRGLAVVVVAMFVGPASGWAGLFIPGDQGELIPRNGKVGALPFDQFRLKLSDVIGATIDQPEPSALRKEWLARRDELHQRFRRLTAEELTALGGYCYRLNRFDEALAAWREATQKDPRNPLPLHNLALLSMVQGDLLQARQYLSLTRELSPNDLPGLPTEQAAWLVRVEGIFRNLLRRRHQEQRQSIPPQEIAPDDLFGVQFVGESGDYETGTLAAQQREKLPDDALAVVQQLIFWMPFDARLHWLLAELYNAIGEPGAALTILNECADARRFQPDRLREHRQIIQATLDRQREEEEQKDFRKHPEVLWAVALIGGTLGLVLIVWQVRIVVRRLLR